MIQYLRFDKEKVSDTTVSMLPDKEIVKFFLKRVLYLFLFVYSTLFLGVAFPFMIRPWMPLLIFFIGGMATMIFLARLINHIIMYFRCKGGLIKVTPETISVTRNGKTDTIRTENLTFIESDLLGNVVIREKYFKIAFPLMLLSRDNREKLLAQFTDMAPGRTSTYRSIWEFMDAIAVALILAVHIIQYVVQAYYIPTGSMEDTLRKGDHLFVEKITYGPIIPQLIFMKKPMHMYSLGLRKVHRGDIVIFKPPHEKDKDYIKRCIAIPGDHFDIRGGYVYINGVKQIEPYTKGTTEWLNESFSMQRKDALQGTVPDGKVIVMGDNRCNSQDSRYFGYLDIDRIKGRAFILYWNSDDILRFNFSRVGLIR